ncbi:uncharacterized protein LOC123554280 [Mercenaria mercenaria]|uniref:uncharacterized protein LOC123554280 n=1 Tax=Mercenaria mercenaria TaxID=6596 RepID=UPI00234ED898|nr:uncharacterized protein LOC123554280 [Mercenaria mercenaria]
MMCGCNGMNVSVVLIGIILYTCILGACAQSNGYPRRGRIIRRFRSNELVIPFHHQQNGIDMRTGKTYASESCSGDCPPKWIDLVHGLTGLNPNISHPMCEFSDAFLPCSVEGKVCRHKPVQFTCCPTRCMPSVKECYGAQPPEFLCMPKSIQPWLQTMFRLNIWGPQN